MDHQYPLNSLPSVLFDENYCIENDGIEDESNQMANEMEETEKDINQPESIELDCYPSNVAVHSTFLNENVPSFVGLNTKSQTSPTEYDATEDSNMPADCSISAQSSSMLGSNYTHSKNSIAEAHEEVDDDGDTPLHTAIINNLTAHEISELPTQYLNQQNDLRQTPLHLGVLISNPDVVQLLTDCDADLTLQDKQLRTPAHIACEKGDSECLLRLTGAPENRSNHSLGIYDNQGQTCLHIAIRNGNIGLVKILLDNGTDINASDRKSGRTALHFAVEAGNIEMINLLLGNAAIKLNALTFAGHTAQQLAYGRAEQSSEVVELLKWHYPAADCLKGFDDESDEDDDEDDG